MLGFGPDEFDEIFARDTTWGAEGERAQQLLDLTAASNGKWESKLEHPKTAEQADKNGGSDHLDRPSAKRERGRAAAHRVVLRLQTRCRTPNLFLLRAEGPTATWTLGCTFPDVTGILPHFGHCRHVTRDYASVVKQ